MFNIRAYQLLLSPILGGNCRYYPSCSEYAVQAFQQLTPGQACACVGKRLLRCHPFSKASVYDPIPTLRGKHG